MNYMDIREITPPEPKEDANAHFHYATLKRSKDRQQLRRKILNNISLKSKKVLMDEQKLRINAWLK